jgi:hypothetical protein
VPIHACNPMTAELNHQSLRWRCPDSVVIVSVVDLDMPLPLALVWRKDNTSPFA